MTGILPRICALFFAAQLLLSARLSAQSTAYELSFPNAAHHEAQVKVTFTGVPNAVLPVFMSRSSPGRYALHEFAKNVYGVHAEDGSGRALEVIRKSPSEWDVAGHGGIIHFEYTLFGDRADGTYAAIDQTHAHLNMPATLAWAEGFENSPSTVKFDIPEGSHWRVATQLKPESDGTWSAPNLQMLMDGPVEISAHDQPEWKIEEATFRLALHHHGTPEQAQVFGDMCKAVVLEEEGVFGGFPKYDYGTYTFLIDYLPYASFDGMEHRDSAVITGRGNLKEDAAREIGAVSHEFFHSWNVRRIRPKSLQPFDFERANMSGELWFAEGFTNYYGPLVLKRAGMWGLSQFIESMSYAVNTVMTSPGREVHNVIGMSDLAPFVDAAASIDPNDFANTFISYYIYGQALAFGLDLAIREQFPGKSLDDWMRAMWHEHPDVDRPYTIEDLQHTLAEITSSDFADEVFREHIYGKAPLDYQRLLRKAGLLLRPADPQGIWLGASVEDTATGVQIASAPLRGSPLYQAGLEQGDRIVDADEHPVRNEADLEERLMRHRSGDSVQLRAVTRAGTETIGMTLVQDPKLEIVPYEAAGEAVTPEITAFRAAWLGSKALHPLPAISAMP